MKQLNCKSFAKINLCLHVLNKREDGFHDIQSIFQMINLYDSLLFTINDSKEIKLETNSNDLTFEDNLITKAFKLLSRKFNFNFGLNVQLKKNIPLSSGLGGGSSNAAVTLLAMNKLFNLHMSKNELLSDATSLGSDVPFFLYGKSAHVTGRGEIVNEINLKKKYFVLIFSEQKVSTKEIFESITESEFSKKLGKTDLLDSCDNSFEDTVMRKFPELMQTKYWLSSFGKVRMSGTGSTLYIEFDSRESAHEANNEIEKRYRSKIVSSIDSYDIFS